MEKDAKLKLNADELKQIHQEKLDIIEKELSQIEVQRGSLKKDPRALTITQQITLLERAYELTEELSSMVKASLQSDE